MRIGEIASGEEYRMDEQFQNFLTFENFLQLKRFWKFVNFSSCKILKKFQFYNWENKKKYFAIREISMSQFEKWPNIRNFSIKKINEFWKLNNLDDKKNI